MTDEQLPFQLDVVEYDWLILGTGYEETLYSAHLSKIAGHQNLVLDFGNTYSSNQRTMNFKEFDRIANDLPTDEIKPYLHKRPVFRLMDADGNQKLLNDLFAQKINSGQEFKHFNIDMQPKLLFSNSPSVSIMQQADLDQYMDFKAVENQYFFDSTTKTFKLTPTSKSDIFKCQFLSLSEKKQFFQLLHTLVKIYHKVINYQVDQNSTQEFDQNTTQLDEETYTKYLQFKNQLARDFLDEITSKSINKDKVYSILFYSICFVSQNYRINTLTTEKFILKFGKYVKSMGIHSKSPFLYTNYGTGDIPQGFCRISAVYGSIFITQSGIRLHNVIKQDDGYEIQSNLQERPLKIKKGIIMSQQIYESYKQQEKEIKILMRVILVTTKNNTIFTEEMKALITQELIDQENQTRPINPSIYVVPCKLFTQNPIYIFRTDYNSNSAHKDYELFYCWTLLEQDQNQLEVKENLKQLIIQIDDVHCEQKEKSKNFICYEKTLLQQISKKDQVFQPDENEQIYVTSEDNDELDFDTQTENFQGNIKKLNKNFEENKYLQGKCQQQVVEQEMDNQQYILNQLMNIKQQE